MPTEAIDDPDWSYGHPASFDESLKFGIKGWDYPLPSILALFSVSFGVKKIRDVYFGMACQLVFWYFGGRGPDGMYNGLAGLQAGRGEWFYAAFPTLLDAYEGIDSLQSSGMKNVLASLKSKTLIRTGAWSLGFYLGRKKYL